MKAWLFILMTSCFQPELADRIANAERSAIYELTSMGREEHPSFSEALRVEGEHEEMWAHLDELIAAPSRKRS